MTSRIFFVSLALLAGVWSLFGQARESGLAFKAGELAEVSQRVAGDSLAWQVVVASAERRANANEFWLSVSAQRSLKAFADLRRKLNAERQTFARLVKRGAPVLAEQEFAQTSRALQAHDSAVAAGNLSRAMSEGQTFLSRLGSLASLVEARRAEAVEATLKKKTGKVEKRKGLLGAWNDAKEGELFAESDAVRTGTQSFATLAFVDGSQVLIDPNTTAVIRVSRLDKLDRVAQADITLVKGSLLSRLSPQAQESGAFKLSAGSSEAIIRSGKFWASVGEASAAKISNYDGTLEVKSGEATITLKKNQGTVVLKGKGPIPPVELLPAPRLRWNGLDTVIFRDNLLLEWNPVPNTARYQLEVSSERDFSQNVQTYSTASLSFWLKHLPDEPRFIRLQAIDKLGLRGADSPTYRILRSPDREPPYLFVQGFPALTGERLTRLTTLSEVAIRGETEPGATLFKDGEHLPIAPDGAFEFRVPLQEAIETIVKLSAFDAAKNRRDLALRLVPIRLEKVREISWSCATSGDTLISKGLPMQARGTAYPNLPIIFAYGDKTYSAVADSKGFWALAIEPLANQTLTVSFESPDSKRSVVVRTYFVK